MFESIVHFGSLFETEAPQQFAMKANFERHGPASQAACMLKAQHTGSLICWRKHPKAIFKAISCADHITFHEQHNVDVCVHNGLVSIHLYHAPIRVLTGDMA